LIPVKERYSGPGRLNRVIEWYPQGPHEWHQEEQIPPIAAGLRLLVVHEGRRSAPRRPFVVRVLCEFLACCRGWSVAPLVVPLRLEPIARLLWRRDAKRKIRLHRERIGR
jgi:hypothetical protein